MIRRFLTRILMVLLIAFCGYNWFQVQSLQGQVRDLQTRLAVRERRPESGVRQDLTTLQAEMKQLQRQAGALWRRADAQTRRGAH